MWSTNPKHRMVIDPGSYSIRLGNASSPQPELVYNNFIAIDRKSGNKIFGPQLDNILDETRLIYEKNNIRGVTVRFESFVNELDDMMAKLKMPRKTTGFYCEDLTITMPTLPFHPRKVMEKHMEIYLEYFRFDGIFLAPSSTMIYDLTRSVYNDIPKGRYSLSNKYALVIESSESATYVTPILNGQPIKASVKRVNVGGRLLTNYLKEILSFRYLDLKDSDRLIKQIKEDLCFVSLNVDEDMRCKKGQFIKHFVLPDEQMNKPGYATDKIGEDAYTQHISLDKQRFQIGQILFSPSDIGLEQKGIVGAIFESLKHINEDIRHNFLENIVITGGNSKFRNFTQRMYNQIKKNCACWVTPMIYVYNPPHAGYEAAVHASLIPNFKDAVILKDVYRDMGPNRVATVML